MTIIETVCVETIAIQISSNFLKIKLPTNYLLANDINITIQL